MDNKLEPIVREFVTQVDTINRLVIDQYPGVSASPLYKSEISDFLESNGFFKMNREYIASNIFYNVFFGKKVDALLEENKEMSNFLAGYLCNIKQNCMCHVMFIRNTIKSIENMMPLSLDNLTERQKRAVNIINASLKVSSQTLLLYEQMIETLFTDVSIERNKEISMISCSTLVSFTAELSSSLIRCTTIHQIVYKIFYCQGKEDSEEDMSGFAKQLQELLSGIKIIDKKGDDHFNVLNKKTEQLQKGQEETQRKIVVQGDKSNREFEKIEDKVEKRNRADKRKPLTQEECADILYKYKVKYFKKKEDYLRLVGITATKPKLPKDEKMVERTIQRWDQYLSSEGEKGSKPPKGYSRERSRKEFDDWAETLEQIAYEKWEKEQPIIRHKNKRDGLVSTLSPEKEDEENIEEEEDDQETRRQGNLVDRVAHPTKRD